MISLWSSVITTSLGIGEANKIGTTIIDLKNKIEVINPSKVDLEPNFIQRFLEKITGKTGLAKYFEKFETYSGLINEIIEKLEVGGQTLKEDNILFMQDRDELKVFTKKIKEKIDILNYSSMKLQEIIAKEKDEDQRDYLKKEVEYQLQQQIIDLQQIYYYFSHHCYNNWKHFILYKKLFNIYRKK